MKKSKILLTFFLVALVFSAFCQQKGYYRFPTLHNNTAVFTAEGDLWKFDQTTGVSARLTTHHGVESNATISPDGKWIAYNAEYEGPNEVYILSIFGGIPKRITFEGMSGRSTPGLADPIEICNTLLEDTLLFYATNTRHRTVKLLPRE